MNKLFLFMMTTFLLSMPVLADAGSQDETFTVNSVSFKMVAVEGGTFMMGNDEGTNSQRPAHEVTLTGYSIGETEVTQELWLAVMGYNPSIFGSTNPIDLQRPVENVTWEMCQEFITMLNQLTGKAFRLPTEAEWEFAARGGNLSQGFQHAGSDDIEQVAWYKGNAPSYDDRGYGTQLVKGKAPNELGLYDMSGNVAEWCQDWYGAYGTDAVTDPTGPETGQKKVLRGGDVTQAASVCYVASRMGFDLRTAFFRFGFRLAL